MGMGGGFGAMAQVLQGNMQNSPNYVDRRNLYGPDDRPIGSTGSMGGMMGPQNATYANTTPNLSQGSNPYAVNTGSTSLGSSGISNSGGGSGGGNSGGPFPLQGQYGIVKMANGGLAGAAQNMADKGRNGDSMLVHMTPGEVKGLQQLAMANGGSLSINPDTGLVEANILKRFLPMIAGAALSPFLTPMGAAAVVGGFEGMRTGDIGKGLMAGLGAYGGAGLTSGLSTAGAQTGAAGTTTAGVQATPIATGATGATGAGAGATQNIGANAIKDAYGVQTLSTPISAPPVNMGAEALKASVPPPVTMGNVGAGFSASPSAIYNAMPGGTMAGLGATAVNVLTPEMEGGAMPGVPGLDEKYKRPPYSYELSSDFRGYTPNRPRPYYRPRGLGYAEGGVTFDDDPGMDMAAGGIAGYAAGGDLKMKTMSLGDGMYRDTDTDTASLGAYDAAMKRMEKQHAAANLKPKGMPKGNIAKLGQMKAMAEGGLGSYSDGGRMLKGPGDGMSDDIPAMIGKRQPARLADGEFVVPADVVSHLGNGSTDAGAKKLYSMMDKVRTARTGKKKQAPAVKTDKYLPK